MFTQSGLCCQVEEEVRVEGIVTQSQSQPPPPPSDAAMSWVRSNIQPVVLRDGGLDDGDTASPAAPLFVIGRPSSSQDIRENSDSDEDVRILPSSSRSSKDSKDVIEID